MQQAGLDHLSGLDALGRQRVAQRETLRRAIAQAELALRRRIEPAIGEIAARLRPDWIVQEGLKDLGGERQRVMQGGAPFVSSLAFRGAPRHRQPRHPGEPLDRLGKAEAFDLDQERKDIAALAGRKIVIKLLLVIDEKRGRALLVERREPTPFAPCLFELDSARPRPRTGGPGRGFRRGIQSKTSFQARHRLRSAV